MGLEGYIQPRYIDKVKEAESKNSWSFDTWVRMYVGEVRIHKFTYIDGISENAAVLVHVSTTNKSATTRYGEINAEYETIAA